MMRLDDLLSRINDLPPMPAIALQLIEITNDPDVDMNTVARMISKDPAMTATLLRLCNSSFYGFSNKVTSIQQATSLFGLKKITRMAVTALSARYLSASTKGYDMDSGELWKHSVATASASEDLAKRIDYDDVGLAYTAGLLHDIGKIIIHEYVAESLPDIRKVAEIDDAGFMNAERQVLGFSHAEAGAVLMEKWNFPAALIEAVRFHHNPEAASIDKNLCYLTQVADAITMMMGLGLGSDGLCYTISNEVLAKLGIVYPEDVHRVVADLAMKIADAPEALTPPKHD